MRFAPSGPSPHRRGGRWNRTLLIAAALVAVALAGGAGLTTWRRRDATAAQEHRMAAAMQWHRGESIAEIGAGSGEMALFAAEQVGPGGRVYANEIDPQALLNISSKAGARGLANVTVIRGTETDANLPPNCCEAVFMRWVYHHFTHSAEMNRSIFRGLRPNGILAIADFSPDMISRAAALVKGHPLHGLGRDVIVSQVSATGFTLAGDVEPWPGKGYCLLFRKPNGRTR